MTARAWADDVAMAVAALPADEGRCGFHVIAPTARVRRLANHLSPRVVGAWRLDRIENKETIMRSFLAALTGLVLLASLSMVVPSIASATCDYSDADQNNGWGWNPEAQESCAPTNQTPPTTAGKNAECVDTDGDGWGWDGAQSCRMSAPRSANAFGCDMADTDCDNPFGSMSDTEYMDYRLRQHIERLSGELNNPDNHALELEAARERNEERQQQQTTTTQRRTTTTEHKSLADERQDSPVTPGLGEDSRPSGECHGRRHC